jgi:hypothetical protein
MDALDFNEDDVSNLSCRVIKDKDPTDIPTSGVLNYQAKVGANVDYPDIAGKIRRPGPIIGDDEKITFISSDIPMSSRKDGYVSGMIHNISTVSDLGRSFESIDNLDGKVQGRADIKSWAQLCLDDGNNNNSIFRQGFDVGHQDFVDHLVAQTNGSILALRLYIERRLREVRLDLLGRSGVTCKENDLGTLGAVSNLKGTFLSTKKADLCASKNSKSPNGISKDNLLVDKESSMLFRIQDERQQRLTRYVGTLEAVFKNNSRKIIDLEGKIEELEGKIEELSRLSESAGAGSFDTEVEAMRVRLDGLRREAYGKLDPWQKTQVARHPERPHFIDYVAGLIEEFVELRGDRKFADDQAIIGGLGRFRGQQICQLRRALG